MATSGHIRGDLKGLQQCGYIDYKGDIHVPYSQLQVTIKSRQVSLWILQEVDNFIEEI